MFILALMMSSCPGSRDNNIKAPNRENMHDDNSFGLPDTSNIRKNDTNPINRTGKKDASKTSSQKKESNNKKKSREFDLVSLKAKMADRGISFENIVQKNIESNEYFIKLRSEELAHFFTIVTSKGDEIKIAYYEFSKYFYPLLLGKEINYLLLTSNGNTKKITKIEKYDPNSNYFEDQQDKLLYHFKEGPIYLASILDKVIVSNYLEESIEEHFFAPNPEDQLSNYFGSLISFIKALSKKKFLISTYSSTKPFNKVSFNSKEYYDENSRKIVRGIIEDHREVLISTKDKLQKINEIIEEKSINIPNFVLELPKKVELLLSLLEDEK